MIPMPFTAKTRGLASGGLAREKKKEKGEKKKKKEKGYKNSEGGL